MSSIYQVAQSQLSLKPKFHPSNSVFQGFLPFPWIAQIDSLLLPFPLFSLFFPFSLSVSLCCLFILHSPLSFTGSLLLAPPLCKLSQGHRFEPPRQLPPAKRRFSSEVIARGSFQPVVTVPARLPSDTSAGASPVIWHRRQKCIVLPRFRLCLSRTKPTVPICPRSRHPLPYPTRRPNAGAALNVPVWPVANLAPQYWCLGITPKSKSRRRSSRPTTREPRARAAIRRIWSEWERRPDRHSRSKQFLEQLAFLPVTNMSTPKDKPRPSSRLSKL